MHLDLRQAKTESEHEQKSIQCFALETPFDIHLGLARQRLSKHIGVGPLLL